MIAEYVATYGTLDPEKISFPRFLSMVFRTSRFEARTQIGVLRGTKTAIGAMFGGGGAEQIEDELAALAYPSKQKKADQRMALTQSRPPEEEGSDAR